MSIFSMITVKPNSLDDTLNEIKRLSLTYSNDIGNLKNLSLQDFFKFVSRTIKYKKDPEGYELLMRPSITMSKGFGDCDDKTILCLAYFIEKKIPCGFSIISTRKDKCFHHVFPFFIKDNKIYDFDATYPDNGFLNKIRNFTIRKNKIIYKG